MLHLLGIIGGLLALLSAVPYIRDILKGSTKPNRVTWVIWVTLQVIALGAQIASGGRDSLLLTIGDLMASSTIMFLSFWKGDSNWHWIDKAALVGAAVGIILWYTLHQPIWALVITVFIDFCGLVPTLRKSYANPGSETLATWLMVGSGAVLGAISVGHLNLTLLIYPIYLVLANFGVVIAVLLGRSLGKASRA